MTPEEIVSSAMHNARYGRWGGNSYSGDAEWPKYPDAISGDQIITEPDIEKVMVEIVDLIIDEFQDRISNLTIR